MHIVSITSQGQISIPAKIRKNLGLDKTKKAIVKQEGQKVIIEPVKDLLDLAGSLKKYAIKRKSIDEIIKMEERAWEKEAVARYKRSLRSKRLYEI